MNKTFVKYLLVVFVFTLSAFADNCTSWSWDNEPIAMETCKNSKGKSGYLKLENLSAKDIYLCWELEYNNGKVSSKKCNSRLKGYKVTRSSCYSCGSVGVRAVRILKLKYK